MPSDEPDKVLAEKTTIVIRHIDIDEEERRLGGGSLGGFSAIGEGVVPGSIVEGGGVVTQVTPTTVTVRFPGGVPPGPIRLPGVDTTVVEESSVPRSGGAAVLAPWGPGDEVIPGGGGPGAEPDSPAELDILTSTWRMTCPGSWATTVKTGRALLLQPTNTGSCECAIFLGTVDAGGRVIEKVILDPGKSLPVYEAAPGGTQIIAACSGGCVANGCFGALTVSLGDA